MKNTFKETDSLEVVDSNLTGHLARFRDPMWLWGTQSPFG